MTGLRHLSWIFSDGPQIKLAQGLPASTQKNPRVCEEIELPVSAKWCAGDGRHLRVDLGRVSARPVLDSHPARRVPFFIWDLRKRLGPQFYHGDFPSEKKKLSPLSYSEKKTRLK